MDKFITKYFALALTVILGLGILFMLKDFLTPIFAGMIFAFLFWPVYTRIDKKIKNSTASAISVIIILLVIVLVPVSAIAGSILSQVNTFSINKNDFQLYENQIKDLTGLDFSFSDAIASGQNWFKSEARQILPTVVSYTSNFLLAVFIMCFIMFYILVQKEDFIKFVKSLIPFSEKNSNYLLIESGNIVRAVVIGQVITAIIQGFLGMFAFILAGVNNAFLWGVIMMILSLIPVVGAFLVWVPAGILLIANGEFGWGIFVLVWGATVVSQADNLIRPKLVNRFANIHPVETLLGIFMGLATFGMIGIIIGPLIISLFKTFLMVYKKEYGVLETS